MLDKRNENSFCTKSCHTKALEELKYANYFTAQLYWKTLPEISPMKKAVEPK